jgi:ER lumen protein retaining receptor
MRKIKEVENLTGYYVLFLGIYRGLYMISWYCRVFHVGWWCSTTIFGGTLAALVYADFLFLYIKNRGKFRIDV